ncbi:MAG: WD40-like repeat, partial [Chthonomonadaceae bacterium]|nr:WD40-like repeat [Chthonomonadaceae bacterium]
VSAYPVLAQKTAVKTPETFTFLDVTDTHQTASGSTEPLHRLAEDAAAMNPRPAFIVDTGDITEAGRPEEYAAFKQAIAPLQSAEIGFYPVPGNHDVRWSPDGKEGFTKAFGKLYQSFDYGAAHFVLLDSTVVLEHWGHFDKAEIEWLKTDLKKVRPETPVFLFMHHPIGRSTPGTRFIDNEYDLTAQFRGHNIVAIFTGHGHSDLVWKVNGITTLMARGLYQGSYYRVNVSPLIVSIDRIVKEKPGEVEHIASIPVGGKGITSQIRAGWDDPDVPFLERRRAAATLEPRAVNDNPDNEKGEARLDDGPWQPMLKDKRDIWRDQFLTKGLATGIHTKTVRITTSNGVQLSQELIFEVERDEKEATRKWAVDLDGPIQSDPLRAGDTLYVSALDGKLYALNLLTGKKRWTFPTKGQFIGSPILDQGTIYVASTDHNLYAIEAANGHMRWHYDTEAPLFATPSVAKSMVCIGGKEKIFGIDRTSGRMRWTQPAGAGSFFQSRAVTDGDTFYLGGWDNTLYALNVLTGTPRWTAKMGRNFYFSPAVASPTLGNGRLYICSNDDTLHAVNLQTGTDDWAIHSPSKGDGFGYASPVFANGVIYVGGLGSNGDIYAFDANNGALKWRHVTGQTMYDGAPKLAPDGKSLAIMALRGHVSVLDTANGNPLWSYELGPGNIFSTPEYDGNIVYTVTMANDVQAINAPQKQP